MSRTGPVVSNAGPLMVLAKLNVLHLLGELHGQIRIARSVYEEAVSEGERQGYEDARTLRLYFGQMGWTPDPVDETVVPADLYAAPLDRGERDTLALALVVDARLVLIDEAVARRVARSLGLAVRGSLGVLVAAYRQRLISSEQLRLYFSEITQRPDIWISTSLVERLQQSLFEKPSDG